MSSDLTYRDENENQPRRWKSKDLNKVAGSTRFIVEVMTNPTDKKSVESARVRLLCVRNVLRVKAA